MGGAVWPAALLGAGLACGLLLIVVGVRGTAVDGTRPPSRWSRVLAAVRSPAVQVRVLGAAAVAAGTVAVTGWPVAAAGSAALVLCWPVLFGGAGAEQARIAAVEALVIWTESLRDTIAAHASLEQAIPASAVNAPPLLRPALVRLVGRVRARVPLDRALQAMAAELDDASADLVIAALMLSVRRRGDRLGEVLSGLATAAREELEMRRRIFAGRVQLRRGMQIVITVTVVFAVFLVAFSRSYVAPYGTPAGQLALAVVVVIFGVAFAWMRRLSVQRPVAAFLARPDQRADEHEQRLLAALTGHDHAGAAPGAGVVAR